MRLSFLSVYSIITLNEGDGHMMHYRKFGISQEGLKLIACMTMLIDHIGAVFFPHTPWLRIIGRVSFPIYCFLLAEGIHYTRGPLKYGLRLLLVAVIAELPYDLLFYKQFTWSHNSVMVTLLLGFGAGIAVKHCPGWLKVLAPLPFLLVSRYLHGSYGMNGVWMILLFLATRQIPGRSAVQTILMILLSLHMAGFPNYIGIQFYAVLAMIPIFLYSGEKKSNNKAVQWSFTLFYPVHLLLLLLFRIISRI